MAGSEGDSGSCKEEHAPVAAVKEEEAEIVDTGFNPDECKTAAPLKGGKKSFLVDSDSKDPLYTSDEWRVANFKVLGCSKRYAHDWTICPFAHPGEKARRRDPKQFSYAGIACPDMKKAGFCGRGDNCPYAHNVFEYWLHPTRYRTQLCNDGTNCTRHVCFFAHTLEEMRPVSGKPAEVGKKAVIKDGRMSPDTPLLTGGSTNSTVSVDMWSNPPAEERTRSVSALSEESPQHKAASGSMDEVMYNLANVKLAMAGERKHEVINMLSQLLHEAVEVKQKDAQLPNMGAQGMQQQPDLSGPFKGLNLMQAQALLAATQPKPQHEMGPEDWQKVLQDMQRNENMQRNERHSLLNHRPVHQALYTAPPGLDRPSMSGGLGLDSFGSVVESDPSRGYSADLGPPPAFPQTRNFWQGVPGGVPGHKDVSGYPPRPPSTQIHRRMSSDVGDGSPHTQLNSTSTPMLEAGLFSNAAANPNALRCQSFDLDELSTTQGMAQQQPARREARRPPISAFQSAAGQDWKNAPGRAISSDLQWGNSGQHSALPSVDLNTITEGMAQFDPHFLKHADASYPSRPAPNRLGSTSLAGFPDTGFNLLNAPLAFPTHQRGGRDPSALHSAPYDLSFAYGNGLDGPPQASSNRRTSMDRSAHLQGWGGMSDFGRY